MPVLILPQFIADLQKHKSAHFARRVLEKTLRADGRFRIDSNDHRFHGINEAWIRYVSRGNTAYRVIYLRSGEKVYLFRAGEHSIEQTVTPPSAESLSTAIPVTEAESELGAAISMISDFDKHKKPPVINRFRRNTKTPQISQEIFSRRNLPHRDIWVVTPFINTDLLLPTAQFGKFLYDQKEDGASISILTSPPKDKNIDWMEKLEERNIDVFVYPKLHAKLYCFVLDENRRYERGVPNSDKIASLILVGSANLTKAGLALGGNAWPNEELCYAVPDNELRYVENYVTELMIHSYDLLEIRRCLAREQWQKLENRKW